jgi:predicted AlkP superfamily phosphohydrolase/phosphomutase
MSDSQDSTEADAIKRVLVLGIDGATFNIIEPLVKNGKLPNLSRLMRNGTYGPLESTLPPVTIPAWVCMMTGKNPGKLGFFDLLKRKEYGVEPNGYCYGNNEPIWNILNQHGIKTGILNLPGTYPPDQVDGFMVTGMLTPSKRSTFSYPKGLGEELDERVSDYEFDVPQWQYFDEGVFIKDIYKITEKRIEAAEYLINNNPCPFYMIVFTCVDRLHHMLWDKAEVLENYWEELDRVIGRILSLFGEETTVFVVSDHGFGPLEKTFHVNEWLRRKGLLRFKRRMIDHLTVKLSHILEKLYHYLGERKLVLPLGRFLSEFLGLDRLRKYTYSYLSRERIERRVDWTKTKAFSCLHSPHFGQIYLNKMGKMKEGCVPEWESDDLRDNIIEELKKLEKTNPHMRVEAYKSEEIYSGPYSHEAPEIVFQLDDGKCEIDSKVEPGLQLFVEGAPLTGWTGTHVKNGVFIASGPLIKKGHRLKKASITDVAPTILRTFGIPKKEEVDGRILEEIFVEDAEFPSREDLKTEGDEKEIKELDEEEKALIESRLRNLGYIS